MDVVAQNCCLITVGVLNDACIFVAWNCDGGMWPRLLPLRSAFDQEREDQDESKEADGKVQKDLEALRISEMQPRDSDIPKDANEGTETKHDNARQVLGT